MFQNDFRQLYLAWGQRQNNTGHYRPSNQALTTETNVKPCSIPLEIK